MGRKRDHARDLAFDLYCKTRNLGTVGAKLGKSVALLCRWKKQDRWEERLAEINLKKADRPAEGVEEGSATTEISGDPKADKYTEGVEETISLVERIVLDRLKNSTIVPRHWQDVLRTLEFLMNEKRLAEGRPTTINQTVVQIANKIMVMIPLSLRHVDT
jgi:hypothetical protein